MVAMTFNSADAPPADNDFAPIPAGEYPMRVIGSEMKATNDGTGQMLVLEMDITDGPSAGRKHWERFNLVNKNPQAVEIAQRSLAQLCTAVGKLAIADSEELHMLPFIGKMKVTPAKGQYGPGNQLAGYKPAAGGATLAKADSGAPASPAPSSGGGKPKAYKDPETGKWCDENGDPVQFFKLKDYEKVEG